MHDFHFHEILSPPSRWTDTSKLNKERISNECTHQGIGSDRNIISVDYTFWIKISDAAYKYKIKNF